MSTRATYHHGALREALLREGHDLLAETSPEAFSLNALARRVGVSSAAPYRHFADRMAILDAIADQGYVIFGQGLDEAVAAAADPGDAIRRIGRAYLDFADAHRTYFSVMFKDREGRPNEVGPSSFGTFAGAVIAAQATGHLDAAADPRALSRAIWAALHGAAVLDGAGAFAKLDLAVPREQLVDEVIGTFLTP